MPAPATASASSASGAPSRNCSKRSRTSRRTTSTWSASRNASTRPRPPGELVFHVFGAIAHFERRLISERTRDGIVAARKRRQEARSPGTRPGDHLGCTNPCRGWFDGGTGRETTGYWEGYGLQDHQGGTLMRWRPWRMPCAFMACRFRRVNFPEPFASPPKFLMAFSVIATVQVGPTLGEGGRQRRKT